MCDACVHTSSSNRSPRSAAADLYVALLPHREAQPVLTANTLSVLVRPVFQSLSCDFACDSQRVISAQECSGAATRRPLTVSVYGRRWMADRGRRREGVRSTLLRFTLNISIYTTYVYCMDTACSCCRSLVAELEAAAAADLG